MSRGIAWLVWLVVIFAFWLTATFVTVSPQEQCERAGGEWNVAWSRCYGD